MEHTYDKPTIQAIAQSVTKARQRAGIKQETAAKALGITRSTLSRYENGNMEGFTVVLILKMSRLYNCTITSFFESSLPPTSSYIRIY